MTRARIENFSSRAAHRFNALLSERGFPQDLLGRAAAAAGAMPQIGEDQARQMLAGVVPWTWDQLETVCGAFGVQPGYFLDDRPTAIPSDTRRVLAVDGNETIALRLPRDFAPRYADGAWQYALQQADQAFPPAGSLVVFTDLGAPAVGDTYALETPRGTVFMRCADVSEGAVRFDTEDGEIEPLVVRSRSRSGGTRILGQVIAAICVNQKK